MVQSFQYCDPSPTACWKKYAMIKDMEAYRRLYKESIANPQTLWAEQARNYLSWFREWDSVLRYNFEEGLKNHQSSAAG